MARTPAQAHLRRWRSDPVAFAREVLHFEPDAWQAEVLRAAANSPRVALKACKGPGKSAVLAVLVWWFLLTRPHPKVVCSSITSANLKDGLWTELAIWYGKAPILQAAFELTTERIFARQHPKTWWASARSWPQDGDRGQQANTLAGLHGKHVAVVLDEVSDYPDGVVVAAEAIFANATDAHLWVAGNPTRMEGPLWRICTKDRPHWFVKEITGDPDDPGRASRISVDWARKEIESWGKDSAYVLVNVFGRFPPVGSDKLLGPDEVTKAMSRVPVRREYEGEPVVFGLDVALQGDDSTVLIRRQGCVASLVGHWRVPETGALADQIAMKLSRERDYAAVFIDVTGGWGQGVYLRLKDLGFPNLLPVDFGSPALDEHFLNRRAEMHWNLSAWVKSHGVLPNDAELHAELTAPGFRYVVSNKRSRFKLEPKEDIKGRLGRSPDKSDALALTFAAPVASRAMRSAAAFRGRQQYVETEFDPWAVLRGESPKSGDGFDPWEHMR